MINPLKMRHISNIWELHEKIKILCIMKLRAATISSRIAGFCCVRM